MPTPQTDGKRALAPFVSSALRRATGPKPPPALLRSSSLRGFRPVCRLTAPPFFLEKRTKKSRAVTDTAKADADFRGDCLVRGTGCHTFQNRTAKTGFVFFATQTYSTAEKAPVVCITAKDRLRCCAASFLLSRLIARLL